MTKPSGKFRLDRVLLSLIVIQIIIDLPFFLDFVYTQLDTQYAFQWFYFSYNDFFFFNELPRWVPFGFYGVQSDYFALLPTDYLVLFIGKALGITNVLSVFKFSIFLQQIIFLLGVYLLSRRFFKRTVTVFIVCVLTICSTVLYFQLHQNFADFIYLPLILFFIHKFFCVRKPQNLAIMLNILILSLFGLGVYLATLPALVISIFFLVMCIANIRGWREYLKFSKRDVVISAIFLSTFIIIISVFYLFITTAMEFTEGIYIGRDPVTKVAYLDSFLVYASQTIGFDKFKGLVYPSAGFIVSGLTLHIGLIPLFFAVYALVFVRSAVLYAISAVVTVFVLFSLGSMTPVAEFLYNYFPTMKYYRHIGHSVANLKLFLPLMAGFGIDHLLCRLEGAREGGHGRTLRVNLLKISTAVLVLAGTYIYSTIMDPGRLGVWLGVWLGITIVFLILLSIFHTRFRFTKSVGFFIALCVLFQIFSYRVVVDTIFHRSYSHNAPKDISLQVSRYSFQGERKLMPDRGRSTDTLSYVNRLSVNYTLAYNYIQFDPCVSEMRTDFLNENLVRLFKARGSALSRLGDMTGGMRLDMPNDPALLRALGCLSPKLKLFSDVVFFDDAAEAEDFVGRQRNIDRILVLNDVPQEERALWHAEGAAVGSVREGESVKVSAFSANELSIDVNISTTGAKWLYYVDAFHPGWKVFVNGALRPIARANIAFKAVRLDKGKNKVRFVFDNKKSKTLLDLMIFFGIVFVVTLLIFFLRTLFSSTLPEEPPKDRADNP